MLRVLDVPHFQGILVHAGNTEADTARCILVGHLTNSRTTETRLKKPVATERAKRPCVCLSVKS